MNDGYEQMALDVSQSGKQCIGFTTPWRVRLRGVFSQMAGEMLS
jgi:hypothetical protein